MKSKLSFILLPFLLSSCGIFSTNKDSPSEYDHISNADFKKKGLVKYNQADDSFKNIPGDIISPESLLYVENLDEKNMNPIFSKAVLCKSDAEFQESIKPYYHQYKKHPSLWNILGACYLKHGDLTLAEMYLRKALSMDRTYSPALSNLGVLYLKRAKKGKSLSAFQRSVSHSENSVIPKLNLSILYLKYYQANLAINILSDLSRNYPNDARINAFLFYAYKMKGDAKRADTYKNRAESYLENF